jgi:beta-1,4-mannosyltransferase
VKVVAWPAGGANPYIPLLYEHLRKLGAEVLDFSPAVLLRSPGAIWHIHWPERMLNRKSALAAGLRAAALLTLAVVARLQGSKLVWTIHNLRPHEHDHPRIGRWFWPVFVRLLGSYIVLSEGARRPAERRHPGLRRMPGFVVPHGHYRGAYPDSVSREEARRHLGLSKNASVALFIGLIRPYKNVPHLIRTFRQLRDPESRLVVAGEPLWPAISDAVREAAAGEPRVHLALGHVPVAEVQVYLRAADLVVLPFSEPLNSGSALLALSFDRPVLVPRRGALAELEVAIGSEWVRTYEGSLTDSVLAMALERARRIPRGRCEELSLLDWGPLAHRTLEAFDAARRGDHGRPALRLERARV